MILTKEKGQRMWGGTSIGGMSGGGGGGGVSESWVSNNFVSIDFFNRAFEITGTKTVTVTDGNGDPVGDPVVSDYTFLPNELPGTTEEADTPQAGYTTTTVTAITKIEALAGLWTKQFLSALGLNSEGGGGGGSSTLASLLDVQLSSPTNGQALVYDATLGKWTNQTIQSSGGTVTSIATGTGLTGGTITTSGTISINATYQGYISHGETAYGWGNHANAGYLTAASLNGYATQSWADGRFLKLTGGTLTGNLTMKGSNLIMNTAGSSSEDNGDIIFNYGGGYEKARLWIDNTPTSLQGPNWRVYNSGGTLIGTTRLALLTDNVASATKLKNTRTLWGQNFDGTANVSGNMTDVGSISMTAGISMNGDISGAKSIELNNKTGGASGHGGFIDFHYGMSTADYTARIIENAEGVLAIQAKTTADVSKPAGLVVGNNYTGSYIQIGNMRLEYDAANNALKLCDRNGNAANFYALGGVSALGFSNSGGSSVVTDLTIGNSIKVEDYAGNSLRALTITKATSGSTTNYLDIGADFSSIYHDTRVRGYNVQLISGSGYTLNMNAAGKVTFPNHLQATRVYLDSSRYLEISGSSLIFSNGTTTRTIATL